MESPEEPNGNLTAETGTGFINVINDVEVYPSPHTIDLVKSFDKETKAKLEDRIV